MAARGGSGDGTASESEGPPLVLKVGEGVNVMLAKVVPQLGNWRLYDEKTDGQDGWNLYWRSNSFVKDEAMELRPWQRINSFPRSYMITRKDLLCRAMRKMRKVYGAAYNFAPESFVLPTDLSKLEARMAEDSTATWICKPSQLSRGRGIYLFRTRDRLQYDQNSVVQSYIDRPLLIKGFKFDLRIYVHVTSFSPLTVYLYRKGLARFGTAKYSAENIENVCAHLTNTSINKLTPNMSSELPDMGAGCKWSLAQLRAYWQSEGFDDRNIWRRIGNLAVLSIMALIEECPANPGCRELFGFDVLIDEALKLHLIEVNFGPALALDSDQDRDAKIPLIRDILQTYNFTERDACRKAASPNRREEQQLHKRLQSGDLTALDTVQPERVGDLQRVFPHTAKALAAAMQGRPQIKVMVSELKRTSKEAAAALRDGREPDFETKSSPFFEPLLET